MELPPGFPKIYNQPRTSQENGMQAALKWVVFGTGILNVILLALLLKVMSDVHALKDRPAPAAPATAAPTSIPIKDVPRLPSDPPAAPDTAEKRFEKLTQLLVKAREVTDDRARKTAVTRIQEGAFVLLAELLVDDPKAGGAATEVQKLIDQCAAELRAIGERARDHRAKKLQEYQQWVMDSVKGFNGVFAENDKLVKQDKNYKAVMNAIVDYLLPVDTSVLDTAVAAHYRQAFDKGWTLLAGRDDQTYVANKNTTTKKKTIDD